MEAPPIVWLAAVALLALAGGVAVAARRRGRRAGLVLAAAGVAIVVAAAVVPALVLGSSLAQPEREHRLDQLARPDPEAVRVALAKHARWLGHGVVVAERDGRLLVSGGDPELVQAYARHLTHPDAAVRREAARHLLASGHPHAVEAVVGRLIRAWVDRSRAPGPGHDDDIAAVVAADPQARTRLEHQASLPPYRDLAVVGDGRRWTLGAGGRPVLAVEADGSWSWGSTHATLGLSPEQPPTTRPRPEAEPAFAVPAEAPPAPPAGSDGL